MCCFYVLFRIDQGYSKPTVIRCAESSLDRATTIVQILLDLLV